MLIEGTFKSFNKKLGLVIGLAMVIPEKKEFEYKDKDIDLKVGVERKGAVFRFYLSGEVRDRKIDANVSENYGSLISSNRVYRASSVAKRFNEMLLSEYGFVLPYPGLNEKIEALLCEFKFI